MIEYRHQDGLTHISLDDGKVNALGTVALADLNTHLDHTMRDDAAAVIITGREGVFSAGFDLKELRSGDAARESLRRQLIDLALRIFSFERPVIVACSGHALAAGAALLLAADRRIGLDGPFNLGFTEAKLGVSLSPATVELVRDRQRWWARVHHFDRPIAQSSAMAEAWQSGTSPTRRDEAPLDRAPGIGVGGAMAKSPDRAVVGPEDGRPGHRQDRLHVRGPSQRGHPQLQR